MRQSILFIFLSIAVLGGGCLSQQTRRELTDSQLNAADLSRRHVIGALGLPLGTVTEIQATIIAGSELGSKGFQSDYLLRVTDVAHRPLKESRTMQFQVPRFVNIGLARNQFDLYEMKTGKKTGQLESDQIAILEQGYVGKKVRLDVFETGGFSGIPANLPPGMTWQDRAFGFSTYLIVLAER